MEIIKIHYTPSKEVTDFNQIKQDANEIKSLIESGKFRGVHKNCYAIHHAQVSWYPYNFFVVGAKHCLGDSRLFDDRIIINPKIIKAIPQKTPTFKQVMGDVKMDSENNKTYERIINQIDPLTGLLSEGCMSFPFRAFKKVERYWEIEVEYQNEKMQPVHKVLTDIAAHVFQHETDHGLGKNIYFTGYV